MIKRKIKNYFSLQKIFKEYRRSSSEFWESKIVSDIDEDGLISLEISEYNPLEMEVVQCALNAIRKKNNFKASLILSNFKIKDLLFFHLFRSFNNSIIYWRYNINQKLNLFLIRDLYTSIMLFKDIKSIDNISKLKYKNYLIGDLVYDSYVRLYDKSFIPAKDFLLFKLVFKSVVLVNKYCSYFKSNPQSKICISGDKCYIYHGLFLRVGYSFKNKCYYYNGRTLKEFNDITESFHKHHPLLSNKELTTLLNSVSVSNEIDKYFKTRFSGNVDELDVYFAFKDKKHYTKEDLTKSLGLDKSKKNALIMPHAIKDFPHVTTSLFGDFYQWLLNILIIAKENNSVNWLIKPHPTSYLFGEIGVVEKLMKKLNVNNVKVLPKNFSTSAIPDLADIILTVCGTSGLEFACFGIPVINAGNSMYSNYDFNIEPKSKVKYYNTLSNISEINKLTDDQITTAKKVAYYIFIYNHHAPSYVFKGYKKGQSYLELFSNCIANYNSDNAINSTYEAWIKKYS